MVIELSDAARQHIRTFEAVTDARAIDCVLEDGGETVVFIVPPADMATAIGAGGQTVQHLEERLGARVIVVEDADRAEDFVANALAPAAVYDVTVSHEDDERVATVTVDADDMGVAIGRDGERVERARLLAQRHFEITDIQLVEAA